MVHPAANLFHGQRRAELEDFDVLRFDHGFEAGEVDHARTGRAMIAAGKLHVVDVEPEQVVAHGFQVHRMHDEPEVFFDLRVSCVVPVPQIRAVDFPE